MKIALFKDNVCGFDCVAKATFDGAAGYTRVSEFVEVEFIPLREDVIKQLAAIEAARLKVEKKYDAELARLDERKAQLQAGLPECAEGVAA